VGQGYPAYWPPQTTVTTPTDSPGSDSSTLAPAESPVIFVEVPAGLCFSGETTVQVEGKGVTSIQHLNIGDNVLVAPNKYQPVYSFGHRDESATTQFLHFTPSNLELTPAHMLFIQDKGFVPAGTVKVGDRFGNGDIIEDIKTVSRSGIYGPLTLSGTIVVNGVLSSTYISIQSDSAMLRCGSDSYLIPLSHQWVNHAFMGVHRLMYHWMGMEDKMVEGGISGFGSMMYDVAMWFLGLDGLYFGLLLVPFLLFLLCVGMVESVVVGLLGCDGGYIVGGCAVTFIVSGMYYTRSSHKEKVA